jgi:cell division protein FtsI/penicillin-binding protein 2
MLALVAGLTIRLYFLQVMSGSIYAQEASQSILRTKSIPAPRGNIFDRNGKLLVKSIFPAAVIQIVLLMEVLERLVKIKYPKMK